jgi:hypothetical protein
MVDLRFRTHGHGATTGVNLVVLAYDDRVDIDGDGAVTHHHLDVRVHPGDRRAPGETDLALVPLKHDDAAHGHRRTARYTAAQFASIVGAAGANTAALADANGQRAGAAYGVKADLLIADGDVVVNTRTLAPTDLSVGPDARGRDIRSQVAVSTAASSDALERAERLANQRNRIFTADTKEEALVSEG